MLINNKLSAKPLPIENLTVDLSSQSDRIAVCGSYLDISPPEEEFTHVLYGGGSWKIMGLRLP